MSGQYIEFKCVPNKCVYSSEDFKIYGVTVNKKEFPMVWLNKYFSATIIGNFQELVVGKEYSVKALEEMGKYGKQYKIQNIRFNEPLTIQVQQSFLREILTPAQAETLISVYPNIVEMIIKGEVDNIDLSATKGIKEATFEAIKRKVVDNYVLVDLVDSFGGYFSISILRKLYEKYPSIEKVKEMLSKEPYECLCGLNKIGFKTADALLMSIEKKKKSNDDACSIDFDFELKTSYQRMKACVFHILDENENGGNTFMKISDLKSGCEILVPECMGHLADVIKTENVYFEKESLTIAKKLLTIRRNIYQEEYMKLAKEPTSGQLTSKNIV